MKGVIFEKVGAAPQVVADLKKPEPASDQILCKSIYAPINPVDTYMSGTGLLVTSWPFVLGCDAGAVVVEVGDKASAKFKAGDHVCGCTRVGVSGYSTCQEYFLMDAEVTIPKPKNISLAQASTLGVGTETACLALYNGLNIPLPDPNNLPDAKDEWAIVLGGASSVGKYAIQLLKASGYKVLASCSARSAALVRSLGADALLEYKNVPVAQQVKTAMTITGGNLSRIFDAAASNDDFARAAFEALGDSQPQKYFATTNDWSNLSDFAGGKTYCIELGEIGRPEAPQLKADIARFIPLIVALVEKGLVVPNLYDVVGSVGFESAIEALEYQKKGAGGSNKVLAKLQDEE